MLRKINQEKVDICLYIYLWFFLVYTLIGRIAPLAKLLEGPINSIIFILFAFFGALFVALDFFTTRYMFKPKYTIWLILFMIVMIISSVLNAEYGIVDNIKTLVWTGIHFLLLYPLLLRGTSQQRHKFLRILIQTLVVIFGIAVFVSLIQYLLQIGYEIHLNHRIRQGFVDNRLFGVFRDPNFAGSTSLITIIGCLYLIYTERKKSLKYIWIFNLVIEFLYIVLCGSRSVLLAYIVTIVIFFFLVARRYALIHYDRGDRILVSIISVIIAVLLSISMYYGTRVICEAVPIIIGTSDGNNLLEREDVDEANISNNRFEIWEGYIENTLKDGNVLFGLSPRNTLTYIQQNDPDSYVAKTGYETHNGYVSVFAGVGIVGFIVMAIFIIISVRKAYIHVFIHKDYNVWFILSLAIVGGLACYSFFLTDLFFVNNLTTIVFWPLLGYLNVYTDRWNKWGGSKK